MNFDIKGNARNEAQLLEHLRSLTTPLFKPKFGNFGQNFFSNRLAISMGKLSD